MTLEQAISPMHEPTRRMKIWGGKHGLQTGSFKPGAVRNRSNAAIQSPKTHRSARAGNCAMTEPTGRFSSNS